MAGKPKNRVGEVYSDGKTSITIVSISEKREKSGSACWNGLCSCGETRNDIPGSHLFHGKRRSRKSVTSCIACAREKQRDATSRANISREESRRLEASKRRDLLKEQFPSDWLELPRTLDEAKEDGSLHYFNGLKCPQGHLDVRLVSSGCMSCRREQAARRRATPEGQQRMKAESAARWADPVRRAKAQAQRAAWAKTEKGRRSLRISYQSFYYNNLDRLRKENVEKHRQRYRSNPNYRLRMNLARRILLALANQTTTKDETTLNLVGCPLDVLVDHLETQFDEWMNWENMGDWHVDHVRPCASFDLSDPQQQSVCFNWRNLQPLDGDENYKKRDSYTATDEEAWIERMQALGYEGELFVQYVANQPSSPPGT